MATRRHGDTGKKRSRRHRVTTSPRHSNWSSEGNHGFQLVVSYQLAES